MSHTRRAGRSALAVSAILLATLALRLAYASMAPLANDEAYYWDFGRALRLSYLDHPPGVAWLAAVGEAFATGPLAARLAVPFVHLIGTVYLLRCLRLLKREGEPGVHDIAALLFLTEVVPAFQFEGVLLLPDAGLLGALAAALYYALRATAVEVRSAGRWALPTGVALGLAGLCKYHAAPLALGLGAAALLRRPGHERWAMLGRFLGPAALIAAAVTAPVWVWNARHDFASFRFQGEHGFGGLGFEPLAAARVFLGQLVILTPLVFAGAAALALRGLRPAVAARAPALLPIMAFLPLFLLLEALAFGKQMLPHWIAPAYWMMAPLYALTLARARPWRRPTFLANAALAVILSYALPWILCLGPLRRGLVAAFAGRPGPLSELTLWEPLAEAVTGDGALAAAVAGLAAEPHPAGCPTPVALASLRWFWTAQLAFHLPGQPRVYNLDLNHPSYYDDRDDLQSLRGCPVLILGDQRHLDPELLGKVVTSRRELPVTVPTHLDTSVVALLGHFR